MTNLSDCFPTDYKEDFSNRNIKIGTIIRCFVGDTNPPKIKRFLIVATSNDHLALAVLYFNTEINPNIFISQELKDLHIQFVKQNREHYLDSDCYLDCSVIIEKEYSWLQSSIVNSPDIVLGEMESKDFDIVKSKIKSTRTISLNKKKKFNLHI